MRKAFLLVLLIASTTMLVGCTATPSSLSDPARGFNESNDNRIKEEAAAIVGAVFLYQIDHDGVFPTAGGEELPEVRASNIMEIGALVSELDGVSPAYIASLPLDPNGDEYRIGLIGGAPIVAGVLSDGSIHIETGN